MFQKMAADGNQETRLAGSGPSAALPQYLLTPTTLEKKQMGFSGVGEGGTAWLGLLGLAGLGWRAQGALWGSPNLYLSHNPRKNMDLL